MRLCASVLSLALSSALAPSPARAADDKTLSPTVVAPGGGEEATVCSQGKNKRSVALTFADPTGKPPCQVHYRKDTEQPGHDQVVFKADHDVAFCRAKAQTFVDKLTGMGWTCAKGS